MLSQIQRGYERSDVIQSKQLAVEHIHTLYVFVYPICWRMYNNESIALTYYLRRDSSTFELCFGMLPHAANFVYQGPH